MLFADDDGKYQSPQNVEIFGSPLLSAVGASSSVSMSYSTSARGTSYEYIRQTADDTVNANAMTVKSEASNGGARIQSQKIPPDASACSESELLKLPPDADMLIGPLRCGDDHSVLYSAYRLHEDLSVQLLRTRIINSTVRQQQGWSVAVNVHSTKAGRWQMFTICNGVLFTASQNAATLTSWSMSRPMLDEGIIEFQSEIPVETYPLQLMSFDNYVYLAGRNTHYDDIKQIIPTAELAVVRVEKGGDQVTKVGTTACAYFDAISQISMNKSTIAVTGFPRDRVRYDETGKRQCDSCPENRFKISLLSRITTNGVPSMQQREICDHTDVVTQLQFDTTKLYTSSFDNTVRIFNVPDAAHEHVTTLSIVACCLPTSIAPAIGNSHYVTTSLDGTMRLWDNLSTSSRASQPKDELNFITASIEQATGTADEITRSRGDLTHITTPLGLIAVDSLLVTTHTAKCIYDPVQFRGECKWDLSKGKLTLYSK